MDYLFESGINETDRFESIEALYYGLVTKWYGYWLKFKLGFWSSKMTEKEFKQKAIENGIPEVVLKEQIIVFYKLKEICPDLTFEKFLKVIIDVQNEPEMEIGVDG